eukprot:GCRY01000337.1.p1 GENE.GCRY01000337.1~~GCRY01000337.1.p1  ORF type:complete len:150 (-),score=27.76 GCRY01000337.1:50-442(-)
MPKAVNKPEGKGLQVELENRKNPVRGLPKSGKTWKKIETARSSSKVKIKAMNKSWEKKMQEKKQKEELKAMQKEIQEREAAERKALIEKQKEKQRIKEENKKKSSVVQAITDTSKLKRMSKKQLAMLEKR